MSKHYFFTDSSSSFVPPNNPDGVRVITRQIFAHIVKNDWLYKTFVSEILSGDADTLRFVCLAFLLPL